jgi:DNA-binding NarL/FixJ family response regulator
MNGSASVAANSVVRLLLADDQRLMREGLRTLLELQPDLRVVGEAVDGLEAERLAESLQPDVVLMDLRMPRCDGVTATRRITRRWPDVHVLVLTTFDEDDLVFESLEAGAAGYLLKDVGSDALADAVRATMRGDSPLEPSVARKVLQRWRAGGATSAGRAATGTASPALPPGTEPLTARELDVLRLLGGGATNRDIAEVLVLSEGTVKNYISAVLAKTGLHDRTQAALFAVRYGLA